MELREIRTKFDRVFCYENANRILDECEIYHQTDDGMDTIFDTWSTEKSTPIWNGKSLFEILASHPNYVPEKGYIVFSNSYDRPIDISTVKYVLNTLIDSAFRALEAYFIPPYSYEECRNSVIKIDSIWNALHKFSRPDRATYNGRDINYYKSERTRWDKLENRYYSEGIEFVDGIPYAAEDVERIKNFKFVIRRIRDWVSENYVNVKILTATEDICKIIEDATGIKVHEGTKMGKVIQRICREYGVNKLNEYNSLIARLGDAISPIQFTRHTIISINPIDYWTMSYGTDWCSCANIDKRHNRFSSENGMYGDGCCSSGTESYMLDPSTVVMYTVDSKYDGKDFELQDKINRCLFHVGEAKFIMGRVYPQGTDGEEAVYKQWREVFQHVMAECMNVPNYWKTEKDTYVKREQQISEGTHYRDYLMDYCNVAGWSYNKPTPETVASPVKIVIGHNPICPCCGKEHTEQETIECTECYEELPEFIAYCSHCGGEIREGNEDYIYCSDNDRYYCDYDCAERENVLYCEDDGEYHNEDNWFIDAYNDEVYSMNALEVETEDGHMYSSIENAYNDGYDRDSHGNWYPDSEFVADEFTGEIYRPDSEPDCLVIEGLHFLNEENARNFGCTWDEENGKWVLESEVA